LQWAAPSGASVELRDLRSGVINPAGRLELGRVGAHGGPDRLRRAQPFHARTRLRPRGAWCCTSRHATSTPVPARRSP
jgi:hypothetical protein